ncbi:diguanylate cyclase [Sphingopyxis sp.]|jgi:diguanylate cyclase (GGDEF)-like protein|uniref:sensor domain-containing diguanylate cyclase n=1 Tax=Sphingopyxis sp. TaxID=1908224 RepID=UPI0026000D97|nr:diguanylate cyclase [Sphingopyxis sp.]MBK6413900.1 diguanylate cyclase [Sphingopyxis sp.]
MPFDEATLVAPPKRLTIAPALVGALLYFAFATITILLTSDGRSHATVWLADAAVLAVLLSRPKSEWPLALLFGWAANLAANALTRDWAPGIVLYGGINMGQVLLAGSIMRRKSENIDILADTPTALSFLFWAGFVAPAAGAIIGSAVSVVNYGESFLPSFARWYAGNALGFVILTPFLKSWFDGGYVKAIKARLPRQRLEDTALLFFHGAVSVVTFGQSGLPLLFAPLCSLLVLAIRSGRLATQAGVVMVGVLGALAAVYHVGPVALIHRGPVFEAIFFQSYLAIMLAAALPVAALVASRAEALADAARREELLAMILENSPDAILSFDAGGRCQWVEGATDELIGLSKAICRDAPIDQLSVLVSPVLSSLSDAALATPSASHLADLHPASLPTRTLEVAVKAVLSDDRVVGTVAMIRDVTRQRAREREIARLAVTDPLTRIANRAGFEEAITRRRTTAAPACIAIFDIDDFKSINDRWGHQVGDRILKDVATVALAIAGDRHFIARLGGDEFVMLLECDLAAGWQIIERVREEVSALSAVPGAKVTISAGIAELGDDPVTAVEVADRRLYLAKRSGRNRTVADVF